jgi:hypothetical protein
MLGSPIKAELHIVICAFYLTFAIRLSAHYRGAGFVQRSDGLPKNLSVLARANRVLLRSNPHLSWDEMLLPYLSSIAT